jgi:hypothetical protein
VTVAGRMVTSWIQWLSLATELEAFFVDHERI